MSNMSYCRFENTFNDFMDCLEALEDMQSEDLDNLSASERRYAEQLACRAADYIDKFDLLTDGS